jgi:hypothetical protein
MLATVSTAPDQPKSSGVGQKPEQYPGQDSRSAIDRAGGEEDNTMRCGFERLSPKVLVGLLPVFVVVALSLCNAAEAYIYDDFSSPGIDTGRWTISDPLHLFFQPGDSQLYFNSDNTSEVSPAPSGSLVSTTSFKPGFFSMDFNQFVSSNVSPGGQGLGSFAALGLGTKSTKYVRMLRGRVVSGQWGYFEANYFDGALLHVWYVFADASSGRLGLHYDGSAVSFYYNNGVNGWHRLDTSGPDTQGHIVAVTPGWSSPPPLFVSGTPGGSGVTSFAVDKVEYTLASSVPTMAEGWILVLMVLLGASGIHLIRKGRIG